MWIKLCVWAICQPLKSAAIVFVWIYKKCISPLLPHTCRFYPTCSTYMILAIKEWGVLKGLWLGILRILKCRPRGKFGEDFVPLNIKGELKWIY